MKKTFIEVNKWNAQRIVGFMDTGRFDPRYIESQQDWYRLSRDGHMSERAMHLYAEHLDWSVMCVHQTMSEQFIRDHMDYLESCMFLLCGFQSLSIDFIRDYEDKISWLALSRNKHLTDDIKEEFHDKLAYYLATPVSEIFKLED